MMCSGRLAVHRVARVRRVEHRLEAFLRREVDRERDHLGPRPHHVGCLLVGEVEDLVEHLLLFLLELAFDGRALEQHLQLGLGVDGTFCARWLQSERAQGEVARALQEPDQRLEQEEEGANRRGDEQRGLLGVAERDSLRDELTRHDVEVRQDEQREHDRDHRRHHRVEGAGQRVLPQSPDRQ